jgi:hypothetical protein
MCRKRKKRSGEKERRDGDEDLTGRWERIKDEREGVRHRRWEALVSGGKATRD